MKGNKLVVLFLAIASLQAHGHKFIDCTVTPRDPVSGILSHPHIPGPTAESTHTPGMVTSMNWSGFAAATSINAPARNSVTAVYGSWIVPTIESSSQTTYSSFWVGMDGYASSTVEQIGTEHNYQHQQVNSAWFEMYPAGSYTINGFPLNPGDVISASVVYSGNYIFTLTLYNDTHDVAFVVPTSYTRSTTALRSSAEWVIEAPSENTVLPLADFQTGYMWGCQANINGTLASIGNGSWQNTAIEMVTSNGTAKAIPSSLLQDKGSFFVTWKHQ